MPDPNFQNRTLYHKDNLEIMRGMNSKTVHLIATDPPFKKNRDFHATPDSLVAGAKFSDRWKWDDDVHPEWTDQIEDDWPAVHALINAAKISYGMDMAAFLCWLGVRLMEMRRILRDDGSLYLHIDQTAHAWVKALMDGIFNHQNYRNAIVWQYDGPQRPSRKNFATKHDTILRYTRTGRYNANTRELYPIPEDELRKNYRRSEDGRWFYDLPRGDYTDESIARLEKEGRIRRTRTGNVRVMYYLHQASDGTVFREKTIPDVWSDIPSLGQLGQSKEKVGYPTQKPLALYERIIKASSNPGDIVLDPFCGCATTPIAAERLGRRWVGIDIWDEAQEQVLSRLVREGLAVPTEAEKRDADTEERSRPLLTFGDVYYSTAPPVRTDDQEIAAPNLKLKIQRAVEPWQKLSNREMRHILAAAQSVDALVGCAGCGRKLEIEFMHLDHIQPKSDSGENHITNRVLLCSPCNSEKSNDKTMPGLQRANKKSGWMQDESLARDMRDRAQMRASWVRDQWGTEECDELIANVREQTRRPLR